MNEQKYEWNKIYTIVLIANAVYIILFFILMNLFS